MLDLRYFEYAHLPDNLQEVSKIFHQAVRILDAHTPDCTEKEVGLRKLLEAKDCFVRANL